VEPKNIRYYFDVFLTVHHSIELFYLPTLMHNSFIVPLNTVFYRESPAPHRVPLSTLFCRERPAVNLRKKLQFTGLLNSCYCNFTINLVLL